MINNRKGQQELWVFTVRFQKIAAGTLSSSEKNFRILAGKTDDLTAGTPCKTSRRIPNVDGYGYNRRNVQG